jgi:hypothetical protein
LVKNIVQNVFFNCGQYLGGISAAFLLNFGYILVGLFYYKCGTPKKFFLPSQTTSQFYRLNFDPPEDDIRAEAAALFRGATLDPGPA